MMADCLLTILTGDVIGGIICTWTDVIGLYFYAVMLMAIEIGIAIKYDNLLAPSVFGFFVGILMMGLIPPEAWMIPLFIMILNGAAVVYAMFIRD